MTTYSLHPGGVASDIWQRRLGAFAVILKPFLITTEEGAKTQLRCATDPALATESGHYYDREQRRTESRLAMDESLQDAQPMYSASKCVLLWLVPSSGDG